MLGRGMSLGLFSLHGLIKIKVKFVDLKMYIILNLRSTSLFANVCPGEDDDELNRHSVGLTAIK